MRGLALALLLIATPAQAAVLWFAGVETGDLSEFTNTGCVVNGSIVKTGAYAVQCAQTAHFVKSATGLNSGTTVAARVSLYPDVLSTGGTQTVILMQNAADTQSFIILTDTNAKLCWALSSNTCVTSGTTVLSPGVFYLVEARCVISASVGGCEVKLDGNVEFTSFATNTSAVSTVDHVYFGTNTALSARYIFDDMMLCSGAGYCPTGRTIARQGTSGSPTYTAWTKNSCTSSLIENCWSETPFTATTPSASSTVLNDAQTMIVHDFGTTQTGHGTQTVGNTSTVNACKTAMVANAGSTGTLTMRRRISADTDTAKSITTTNAYYDDGIWTTTADILRNQTIEIGATQGENTETQTVRDMWLMCDYANSTATPRHKVIQQ